MAGDHEKHARQQYAATHDYLRNTRFVLEGVSDHAHVEEARRIAAANLRRMAGNPRVAIVTKARQNGVVVDGKPRFSKPSVRFDGSDFLHTPSVS